MKSKLKGKLCLIILCILIVYRALNLPYYISPDLISNDKVPITQSIEYADSTDTFILFQRLEFENGVHSHINGILNIFVPWNFNLSSLFILKVLIIDKRKRLLALITNYFQGSKYKDSFFLSQLKIKQIF